ncbi:hypothetical protein [Paenibacillus graminis]|uniref:hypothetical protein n=1 Tax=Paenibacillus graminis TaxID=189425 RepID=UPI002DBF4AE2|nr:hypothetical protein [Paenibacillus graminis]MEC0171142.1 hypothetical protein [Paenibacillus graminis]
MATVLKQPVPAKDWLKTTFRDVLRLGGVSALLASIAEEVNRRNPEDQERVWELLLPVARAVVWEEYVLYGETLEVGYDFEDDEQGVSWPFIFAVVCGNPGGFAEWRVDPSKNLFNGWDREVRG